MKDRRPIIILVVFLLLLAGVGVWSRRNGGASTSSDSTATTATTTVEPQWRVALDRVIAGENELFRTPNPDRVGEFMTSTCTCYEDTRQRLALLRDKGWHVDGNSTGIGKAMYVSGTTNTMRLRVKPVSGGSPVVDASGKVIQPPPSGDYQVMAYQLRKDDSGVWRIDDRFPSEEMIP